MARIHFADRCLIVIRYMLFSGIRSGDLHIILIDLWPNSLSAFLHGVGLVPRVKSKNGWLKDLHCLIPRGAFFVPTLVLDIIPIACTSNPSRVGS